VVKLICQKAALPPHIDSSLVFARCRQCAPHLIHAFLGPAESTSQTASRSVQPFLQRVPILYNGPPISPSKLLLRIGGYVPHLIHPNDLSVSSVLFAGLTTLIDRQTHQPTDRPPYYSVCNNCPYLYSSVMRSNNRNNSNNS